MIEQWKTRYAHLLDEVPLEHHYSDEARSGDYERLASDFDKDELGGKHEAKAFFSRPQIRREGAPKIVSRTIPGWMLNREAVHSLLLAQFPILREHRHFRSMNGPEGPEELMPVLCPCSKCRRAIQEALLWDFVIRLVRMNRPAEEIATEWNYGFVVEPNFPKNLKELPDEEADEAEKEAWKLFRRFRPEPRKRLTAAYVRRTIQRIREVTAKSSANDSI